MPEDEHEKQPHGGERNGKHARTFHESGAPALPTTDENVDAETSSAKTDQPRVSTSAADDVSQTTRNDLADEATSEEDATEDPLLDGSHDDEPEMSAAAAVFGGSAVSQKRRGFWHWFSTHKKFTIPLTLLIILGVLAAIPFTRFAIAGTFLKQDFNVTVDDTQTHLPVSSAMVSMAGITAKTDNQGRAKLHAKVGKHSLTISKKYYQTATQNVTVPIQKSAHVTMISVLATGRQVPLTVSNTISGKPLANITVAAAGTEAKTDKDGMVTIVLPADKSTVTAQLSGSGYNGISATVQVTNQVVKANDFHLTPAGKLYFLSNLSGKIDVVKTNLDGTERQTVLAGTGSEDTNTTSLLASQDWKYLALLSKRAGGTDAKLYLINTSNDSLTTMDEGTASFFPSGWSGHSFIYQVHRDGYTDVQPGQWALKSYNADSGKITQLDQTAAGGTAINNGYYESYTAIYILNNEVVYGKNMYASPAVDSSTAQATFNSVKPDGTDKHVVKAWANSAQPWVNSIYVNVVPYGSDGVYVSTGFDSTHLYEYEDGQLKAVDGKLANDIYNLQYDTYLFSPSNNQTFWSEPRDGKNTLFVGDASSQNSKQIATLSDYTAYGWYGEDYLLVSKTGSELSILPVSGGTPLKITDYYKPATNFAGYGKGYGGF